MVLGRKKNWGEGDSILGEEREEGILISKIQGKGGENDTIIISIYNSGRWKNIGKIIEKIMEEGREENVIIGGDFNIRIGEEGGLEEEGEVGRKNKDKVRGKDGKNMLELVGEVGGYILNGTAIGDKEGEFTYIGARGSSVIDYVIVNENCKEIVKEFKVGERVDSDHLLLLLEIRGNRDNKEEEEEGDEDERRTRIRWDKKAIEQFRKGTEKGPEKKEGEEDSVEEKWRKLKKIIGDALVKEEWILRRKEIGHKEWWDRSCTKMKRMVQREFRKWKRGRISREKYMEVKKSLKDHVESRRRKKKEEEEEELRNLRNEREVWEFINRRRGKRRIARNNIDKDSWKGYFMELLVGKKESIKEEEEEEQEKKGETKKEKRLRRKS